MKTGKYSLKRIFMLMLIPIIGTRNFIYLYTKSLSCNMICESKKQIKDLLRIIWKKITFSYPPYKIYSTYKTLLYIKNNKCSVSRFGDGEIRFILDFPFENNDLGFQRCDKTLRKRLRSVIKKKSTASHIVCLPRALSNTKNLTDSALVFWNRFYLRYSLPLRFFLGYKNRFFDASCTRLYMDFIDRSRVSIYYQMWKNIWKDQKLVIVEGDKSRLGVGNDLFDSANSISRILIPAENAWRIYGQILDYILNFVNKDCLILIAAGPTASVLSYDLSNSGFWAIDIGHIDIEYCWFKADAKSKIQVPGKYVNEATMNDTIGECVDANYSSQIIARID